MGTIYVCPGKSRPPALNECSAFFYLNAVVEQMIEQTDKETMESVEDLSDKTKKAKMLPISFCIKARKL